MTAEPSNRSETPDEATVPTDETLRGLGARLRELEARIDAGDAAGVEGRAAARAEAERVALEIRRLQASGATRSRREIAQALRGVRRRNRVAAIALALACVSALGGVGALWSLKAQEFKDPVALRFRNPIEFVPVEPAANRPDGRSPAEGPAPNGVSGPPQPAALTR